MSESLSLPITVTCSAAKFKASSKQIGMVAILAVSLVCLTALCVFFLPAEQARAFSGVLKGIGAAIVLWFGIKFKRDFESSKMQMIISADDIAPVVANNAPANSIAKRGFDEFDHIEVVKNKDDDYLKYRIAMRGKTGKEDIIFDQPGIVGETHAYDFARKLGQVCNLQVIGSEWNDSKES